ncbi:hypothetical protein GT755_32905 [Herbidospora sp. NEAU-GS84]|uniref:Uncharacterized protein n=1 Tax=Herbidospora solisilvae TaxID=2696284 RepID=A0A7C9JH34_9ACTN|nr:hypothetical protein [Herbidospora solisilvae]NAS26461.1 hypothetical protein [Herbidospora solisilvae]
MIERADQLVLEFVSRVADAAHGRMRPEERLDYVRRVRERVDQERKGDENPKSVARLLARFGSPEDMVEREVRRLRGEPPVEPPAQQTRPMSALRRTFPPGPGLRPGRPGSGLSRSGRPGGGQPRSGSPGPSRSGPPRSALPQPIVISSTRRVWRAGAQGGRLVPRWKRRPTPDAWSIFHGHPREIAALALLALAALLVPIRFPAVVIFPVPGIVWAVGAVVTLSCQGWNMPDRLAGLGAPALAWIFGGGILALTGPERTSVAGLLARFNEVAGIAFIIGTAAGLTWLLYRLFDPPVSTHARR